MTIIEARGAAHEAVGEGLCLDPDRNGHTTECDRVYAVIIATHAVAMCEAIEAIKSEHLEEPQNAEDDAYDAALCNAISVVRRLMKKAS